MVEQLKSIVEHLKRPPFNRKEYTILTFDRLTNNQLLQVLTDVFAVIDPNERTVRYQYSLETFVSTKSFHLKFYSSFEQFNFSTKLTFAMKNQRKLLPDT